MKISEMEFAYLKVIAFTNNDQPPQQNCHNSGNYARQLNSQACQELFDHLLGTHAVHDDSQSDNGSSAATTTTMHSNLSQLLGGSVNSLIPVLHSTLERHSQLLQILSLLRWFELDMIVELFFSGVIGNRSFESVMQVLLSDFDTLSSQKIKMESEEKTIKTES